MNANYVRVLIRFAQREICNLLIYGVSKTTRFSNLKIEASDFELFSLILVPNNF